MDRRALLKALPALAVLPTGLPPRASAQTVPLSLSGKFQQSGFAIGRTTPRAGRS